MAIAWSSYKSVGGPVSFRTGVDLSYSPSTITAATTSVTVTTKVYLGANGWANATGGSYTVTGDESGSGSGISWNISGAGGYDLIATLTETVPLVYGESQSFDLTATVRPSGSWPGSVSKAHSITVPARPVTAPAPVTGLTAARVSDSRQTLDWTNNGATDAPYQSVEVWRRHITGDGSSVPYARVASLGPSEWASFTDTTTVADRAYTYRVRAVNAGGYSDWAEVSIDTTPAKPARPTASKTASGEIVVTRGSVLGGPAVSWEVQQAGGATLATGLTGSSWTHTAPSPTTAWSYVIRDVSDSPVLSGAWSDASNTIELEAPPYAPSEERPVAADATEDITLTWQHNPADGAPQTAYEVEYRTYDSGTGLWSAWTALSAGKVVSGVSEHVVPAGTFVNGGTDQWRVRTWGTHPDPGPYEIASLNLSGRPVAGIVSPELTWTSQNLTVEWTFHDPESTAQSAWKATLSVAGGDVLETRTGQVGGTRSATFDTPVTDGGTYTVAVEVRDGALLWSDPATSTFTVAYNPPPTPTVDATWHPDDGYTTISVTVPEPVAGVEELVDHVRVERATDAGWVVVAGDLPTSATVSDMIPPTNTTVAYRAVAVSVLESVAVAEVLVQTDSPWVFLNHGAGFGHVVRVRGNVSASRTSKRRKALHEFAGRDLPVERGGRHRSRTYDLSAALPAPRFSLPYEPSGWDDFEALEDAVAPVCLRDPEGVRLFVSVGGVALSGHGSPLRTVSVPLTVVDWSEV